jgi:transmembrane sensor
MDSSRSIHRQLLQSALLTLCMVAMTSLRSATDTQAPLCSTPIVRYTSDVGERFYATLPDGSQISLNTNTDVLVSCSRTGRLVRLLRGEAQIKVRHERAPRPFLVWTNHGVVEDVGTEFSIRQKQDSIEVAVTDGTVRVYPRADTLHQPSSNAPLAVDGVGVELHKGAHVSVSADGKLWVLPMLNNDGLNRLLAWRTGHIDVDQIPLAQAVDEFNRYNHRKYELGRIPPQYANHPLTGYFDEARIDDLLVAAEKELHIRFRKTEDAQGNILLAVAETKPPRSH